MRVDQWTPMAWRMVAQLGCWGSLCVCMLRCLSGPPGMLTGWLIPVASLPWPDGRLPPQPMKVSNKKKRRKNADFKGNIVLTSKNRVFCTQNIKQTMEIEGFLSLFCKKMKNLQFFMFFHVIFAKTMFFTSQNNVFHENDVFFFFIFFWKLSWVGGGPSHLARAG